MGNSRRRHPTTESTKLQQASINKRSQFLIAPHSPILMAYPGATVLELTENGIRPVDYRETEHYQLTRRFPENPERMFRYLLEDKE